ncbi:uncharacterized protein LOC120992507 [Bufo bufo]|uniref:uncharacterized protein LOC120992489 n=1 Tax=Bufo bufo TaxID=8384 RepID=UPI001ABDA9D2|nr:uncharacterized protein LOC120992489 [Bufo bufo]XP_040277447.1 uncharacterized protein LOC120992497 [Bufo bufo]XP_040277459.1 uncharacterized protein LOC120992507 [Bufo bufo]
MSSLTFSYNQEETASILSQVTLPTDFLQTPASELRARDYERESRKLLNHELHCVTLAEYVRAQRIPRGLRMSTRPTIFKEDKTFCDQFEQILNKCSFDLMTLTISHLQKSIISIKESITAAEQQLRTTLAPEALTQLQDRLTSTLANHRKESEAAKRKKFLRDSEDYRNNRVYRWQESYFSQNRRRSSSQVSSGSSTDTNMESSRSTGFLGRRTQGRNRYGGVDNQRGRATVTTRSQMH